MGINFFKSLIFKSEAYDTWFSMYIINNIPPALLYHRQRKKPEILRKLSFVIDTNNFLNLIFFVSFGVLLIFTVLQEIYIYSLRSDTEFMGHSFEDVSNEKNITKKPMDSFLKDVKQEYFLNNCHRLTYILDVQVVFASLSVFFLCFKIVYYWGKHKRFHIILQSITYALKDFPYLIFLMFSFISAFAIFLHIYLGYKEEIFSEIISCYTTLIQNLHHMSFKIYVYLMNEKDIMATLLIFIPYFICVKFVILNLFFSVVYRAYELAKANKLKNVNENPDLSVGEFIDITWNYLILGKKKRSKKNFIIYMQTVNRDETRKVLFY